jgi:dienelactone hydrolase
MYGRSFDWHRQAQRHDWALAWTRVKAPVLAVFGENDWFEDASGVQLIGDIVTRSGGQARVAILPGLDHHFERYPDRRAAFRGRGGAVDAAPAMDVILPWLRDHD